MLERVRNPNAPNYYLYGGRGIEICADWLGPAGFERFMSDMGNRPDGMTLDRIDTDGNYQPGNCRWSTPKRQARNRRQTPEYVEAMRDNLTRGRAKMWSDPEIRAKLVASRRRKARNA